MGEENIDAVLHAAQLGRLDFLSALLALVSVALGLCAIFAFLNLRRIAKQVASEVAENVGKKTAETVANEYLQKEFLDILVANKELFDNVPDESADSIASAQ